MGEIMKYKLIASDFDGTISTSDYKIADGTKEAIADYMKAGGRMVISTGRLYASIRQQLPLLGLKEGIVIANQGSGIYDIATDKPLREYSIEHNLAVKCMKFVESHADYMGIMYYEGKCYVPCRNELIDFFLSVVKLDAVVTGMKMHEYIEKNGITPMKLLIISMPDKQGNIAEECRERFGDSLTFCRSNPILVEIVNKDSGKGNALKYVAEDLYGLKREEVIAIGDAENDISMIEYAGLGVAMGNAMEPLKKAADLITVTNDESGVAKIIREYGLGVE